MSRATNKIKQHFNQKQKRSKPKIDPAAMESPDKKEARARNDILKSLKDADRHLSIIRTNIHGFLKIGHDLFLTSNAWLFTEEVRVNGAKQADAIDSILILRKYMFDLQKVLYSGLSVQKSINTLIDRFKHLATTSIYEEYVSSILPVMSSFGEQLIDCLAIADNLVQKYDDDVKKALPEQAYTEMKRIFKEAAENREMMKEVNLTRAPDAQPDETPTVEPTKEENDNNETPDQTEQTQEQEVNSSQEEAVSIGEPSRSEEEAPTDGCTEIPDSTPEVSENTIEHEECPIQNPESPEENVPSEEVQPVEQLEVIQEEDTPIPHETSTQQ